MQVGRSRCFLVTAFVGAGTVSKNPATINFVADPGETNSVTVKQVFNPFRIELHDVGATMTAGAGCSSVDPNTVRCIDDDDVFEFDLGDGDDFISGPKFEVSEAWYLGGDGDDTVIAVGDLDSTEHLRGGAGNDTLRGRAGSDFLNGGLGADVLRGGNSISCELAGFCPQETDYVSYAGRTNDLFVDQDGVADDGELGEGDMVADDIETIIGGRGNDRLRGGAVHTFFLEDIPHRVGTSLYGAQGDDVLRGSSPVSFFGGHKATTFFEALLGWTSFLGGRGTTRLLADPGGINSAETKAATDSSPATGVGMTSVEGLAAIAHRSTAPRTLCEASNACSPDSEGGSWLARPGDKCLAGTL
jgi:Ca2+-binding RTX toxin-like protein